MCLAGRSLGIRNSQSKFSAFTFCPWVLDQTKTLRVRLLQTPQCPGLNGHKLLLFLLPDPVWLENINGTAGSEAAAAALMQKGTKPTDTFHFSSAQLLKQHRVWEKQGAKAEMSNCYWLSSFVRWLRGAKWSILMLVNSWGLIWFLLEQMKRQVKMDKIADDLQAVL